MAKKETIYEVKQKQKAIEFLREVAPVGSTLYTILHHVSSSGMSRRISVYVIHNNQPLCLDGYIEDLGLYRRHRTHEGLVVGGTGMDMGFIAWCITQRVKYGVMMA